MSELRLALGQDRVMAIIRYRQEGNLAAAMKALIAGGIRVLEVTVDTPGCWDALADVVTLPGVFAGAGTVTTVDEVSRVAKLGGRFIVSPGFDETVVQAAIASGLETFPGILTGTEVMAARRAGSSFFKLFPAGSLGPRYLSELRGPFAQEAFVPTGGIPIADVGSWLRAGAFAVAIGADLAGRQPPSTDEELSALTERAREALAQARSAGV